MGNVLEHVKKKVRMQSPQKVLAVDSDCRDVRSKRNPSLEEVKDDSQFISRFECLYNNSRFSDVKLCVGNDRFFAHKFVLVTASEVFDAMLGQKSWKEAQETEITLMEDEECIAVFGHFLSKCVKSLWKFFRKKHSLLPTKTDLTALQNVVLKRYLYCGLVPLTTETVLPILLLADKYSINVLRASCVAYMLRHIVESPDTNRTLTWYQYSKMTGQQELQDICSKFILSNFDVILQAPDWLELTKMEIVEFLSSSELIVQSEIRLWNKVEKWLCAEKNKESLLTNLTEILPLMRFTMILPKHLLQIESSAFFSENREIFAEKVNQGYRHHSLAVDCGDIQKKTELYRNYYSEDYGVCYSFKLEKYCQIGKIDSQVCIDCDVPKQFMSASHKKRDNEIACLLVRFYPKGFFRTITLYGSYIGSQSNNTVLKVTRRFPDHPPMKIELTLVLYGMKNSVRYIAFTHSSCQIFTKDKPELYVDNVVDLGKLAGDDSPFLIHGNLEGKVFVKVQDCGDHLVEEKA